MNITDKNYINIQGWMRTELDLSGNDLLVFAIIYGFCQEQNSSFSGSLQYLADWCGASKQGILLNLKNLTDRNLIIKQDCYRNNVKYCTYKTNIGIKESLIPVKDSLIPGIKESLTPVKESLINNKVDNKDYITSISKDIHSNTRGNPQLFETNSTVVTKKKTTYDNCLDEIYNRVNYSQELKDILVLYLRVRFSIKDKPMSTSSWISILNKLDKLKGNKVDIVQQSIDNVWATFVEIKETSQSRQKQDVFSEYGKVSSKKVNIAEQGEAYESF